jgi:DNA segregation ATPase FtsK/SpoIIIE-like protein
LQTVVWSLVAQELPTAVQCVLIDPKGTDFQAVRAVLHLAQPIVTEPAAATQYPYHRVVTGLLKANLPMRAAFLPQSVQSRVVIDDASATGPLAAGDAVVRIPGRPELVRLRVAVVSPAEQAVIQA